jgi:hypothetical protein
MGITKLLKEAGGKTLSLFIETDGQQAEAPNDNPLATRPLVSPSQTPPEDNRQPDFLKATPAPTPKPTPPLAPDQPLKIEAIYQQYGVQPAPYTAEQMLDVFDSLATVPPAAKQQTMATILESVKKTLNVTPQSIAQDAARKRRALTEYMKTISDETEREVSKRQKRMDELQKEIDLAKQEIERWRGGAEQATQLCREHVGRLKEVVDYFGGDVSASD